MTDLFHYPNMKKLYKKGEFNFEWLFAIVAGCAILVLAIYGATRFSNTLKYQSDTELAKKLSIILDPLQAGFTEGKSSSIQFNQDTKINNVCDSWKYGANKISASTKSTSKTGWSKNGAETKIENKYLFSSTEGAKKYIVFSVPFNLGFKVSDLLLMTSEKYCYVNPPEEIETLIKGLKIENFKVNNENCGNNSIRVCFKSSKSKTIYKNCNITVYGLCDNCESNFEYGYVEKAGKRLYFIENLVYAAIISNQDLYNCNVKRLFYRASSLSELYIEKGNSMASRSCFENLKPQLLSFVKTLESASRLERFDSVLISINMLAQELSEKNNAEACDIW